MKSYKELADELIWKLKNNREAIKRVLSDSPISLYERKHHQKFIDIAKYKIDTMIKVGKYVLSASALELDKFNEIKNTIPKLEDAILGESEQ